METTTESDVRSGGRDLPDGEDWLANPIRATLPGGRLRVHPDRFVSDAQFWALCQRNDALTLERDADGTILIMSPTGGRSGVRNLRIGRYLDAWCEENGGLAFDSNTMFRLPNGAHRMPDASWVAADRIRALSRDALDGVVPLAPDFVVELRSPSDALGPLTDKMNEYVRTGVRLGWLIDPETRTVTVFHPDGTTNALARPDVVRADAVVEGFELPMQRIWDPLGR